jgi:hypothetical protein
MSLADRMRAHAGDESHLYAVLERAMADDWEAGGPVREICRDWEDAPRGAVVELRLLAGVFRLVLTGRAPELVPYYPCLGGHEPASEAWPLVRRTLQAHIDELSDALQVAPQTNEVGRSAALLVGIFSAVSRTGLTTVRLLELGASGGLNLLVDRFRFESPGWSFGPELSPLTLRDSVVGDVTPVSFDISERRGCDLEPVDATSTDGQLRLRSFIWPFHPDRHARLAAALEIAARHPVTVDRAGAGEWLEDQLRRDVDDDVLTVVWQSITEQYWSVEESQRVHRAFASTRRGTVVRVSMEFPTGDDPGPPELVVTGPNDDAPCRVATVGDHGIPVTLLAVDA